MNTQKAFERLVTKDFSLASFDDLKAVSLAVWHENWSPSVNGLPSDSKRAAVYLLERLMRFNCVSDERYDELEGVLRSLNFDYANITPSTNTKVSRPARKLGLNSDLKLMLNQMLPYQTRHYTKQHSRLN